MNVQTSIAKARGPISAEQIAANYAALEADLSLVIQEALMAGAESGRSVSDEIEAYLRSGDLPGMERYLRSLQDPAFAKARAILQRVIAKAMLAPAEVRAALKREGIEVLEDVLLRMKLPDGTVVTVAMTGAPAGAPATLPVNVVWTDLPPAMKIVHDRAIALAASNVAAMAKELDTTRHAMIGAALREAAEKNWAPAKTARVIRNGLPLTAYQNGVVQSFGATLDAISDPTKAVGITSRGATRWGLWTPRMIADLKADKSPAGRQKWALLGFTETEEITGRRQAKITRQTGTTAPGADGQKPSLPLREQSGSNAWRLVQDGPHEGTVADFLTERRLRDKRKDGLIFDIALANDEVVAAREALQGAKSDAAKAKAQAALDRALARRVKAKAALAGQKDGMVAAYRQRWVRHRARVIARTETMRGLNGATVETAWALVDSGIVEPWQVFGRLRTAEDERVRNSHEQAARLNNAKHGGRGVRVAMGELFEVPGEGRQPAAMRSHPPLGFNCRCVVTLQIDLGAKP
jgi:hypothetical protein